MFFLLKLNEIRILMRSEYYYLEVMQTGKF